MTETKKSARGLEEVSHFFLSRHSTRDDSEEAFEKKARAASIAATAPEEKGPAPTAPALPTERLRLKSAHEVDAVGIPSSALLRAAKTYLLRADDKRGFVAVDNIDSSRFGASDLLLVNKARTRVVCARLSRGKDCEAFVVSAMAFYCWLKKLMQVGAPLFGQRATLDMVLFANGFPVAVPYMMERWTRDTNIHLIQYNIFRVEDLGHPVVRFRPVKLTHQSQRKREKPEPEKENLLPKKSEQESDSRDISHQEWEAFQRLKERAFT
jgi:hypothetical protein